MTSADSAADAIRYKLVGALPPRWQIFPCHHITDQGCSCGRSNCAAPGKHPRTRNGHRDATNSEEQIGRWWQAYPGTNWALATGAASGVIVFDLDVKLENGLDSFDMFCEFATEGRSVPRTLSADSGGGGRHLYFEHPGSPVRNAVGWLPGVDIRGDGGYVLLPPSNHISGHTYKWCTPLIEPSPTPAFLLAALTERPSRRNLLGVSGGLIDLPSDEEAVEYGLQPGQRQATMFRLIDRWWGRYRNREAVEVMARAVWLVTPQVPTPFDWDREVVPLFERCREYIMAQETQRAAVASELLGGRKW